jgi:hypothetical protein
MTWLIQSLLICLLWTWPVQNCVPIMDQIVIAWEQMEQQNCEENNCYWFTIWISWFPYDSDANRVANYWYDQSSGNIDMIATFMAEAMFNKDAVWSRWEKWICQLYPNKTNNKRINDSRWSDIMYQAEVCVDKRLAVPNPSKVWYGWKVRERYKKQIYWFE